MSIVLSNDSDNYTHQIWAQQQAASCAVASIWMARGQAFQMSFAEEEWALAWRIYGQVVQGMVWLPEPSAPVCFDPRAHQNNQNTFGNMFSVAGTFMNQVSQALRNEGLKTTTTTFSPGSTVNKSKLGTTTPAIILLGWYSGGTRRGGHFIVASKVSGSGNVVYLDPWGGVLRELSVGPNYQSTGRFEQICYIST
ncbi:MAG: hypothetical protein DWQ47_06380 [Acidobacteria bacterium]|nr:MAG: hypothetical protein DWQ32_09930 [Acidobacteriota bacterium]REK02000.1 MAG: hypothetical protein DWQ38_06360 [Acidobacteriota bacterium]REK14958.1 MAG: hypothetical protein DWQ43_15620 [Acidobacteriota bacterium]REK45672.1 MAG: hypothetical protein DWQ47_06380 [Acidobacteriota bacterium]